jgi:hypothetical protein
LHGLPAGPHKDLKIDALATPHKYSAAISNDVTWAISAGLWLLVVSTIRSPVRLALDNLEH